MLPLYKTWNASINVISRKDIDSLYLHHVLHSLAIAKYIQFTDNSSILDIGTGGGFPGLPLAIMFPNVRFSLVDSIQKKLKVVNAIAEELQLKNIKVENTRAESLREQFDFIVSRAVAPANTLYQWAAKNVSRHNKNAIANGFLLLKGGNLSSELSEFPRAQIFPIKSYFSEDFFAEKQLVYIPCINNQTIK